MARAARRRDRRARVDIARAETARAALRVLDEQPPRSGSAELLRGEYAVRLRAAESGAGFEAAAGDDASLAALQLRAVSTQREALADLRARHRIGDDAFHVVEEELDLVELTADPRVRPTVGPDAS